MNPVTATTIWASGSDADVARLYDWLGTVDLSCPQREVDEPVLAQGLVRFVARARHGVPFGIVELLMAQFPNVLVAGGWWSEDCTAGRFVGDEVVWEGFVDDLLAEPRPNTASLDAAYQEVCWDDLLVEVPL